MKHVRHFSCLAVFCVVTILAAGNFSRPLQAQDSPQAVISNPTDLVDQIMALIGQSRVDEAIALMDGLKNQPELREAARSRLLHLREDQGVYRSYEVAAVQKFTGQFQTTDVLAYYDEQPVLLRFHLYRPQKQDNVKWIVLGFQTTTALEEITEVLKDTPIDYPAHGK
jgi:hypothetical protein